MAHVACSADTKVECHFGAERTLEESFGGRFSALCMARLGADEYALLSSTEGLFLHRLGASTGRVRLGPTCDAGAALAASEAGLWVACMRRGDADRGRQGRLSLLTLDADGGVLARRVLAEPGVNPGDVDLILTPSGPVVSYVDARDSSARAFVLRVDSGGPPQLLSNPRGRAGTPHLLARGEGFVVTWAETFSVANETVGQIWVADQRLVAHRAFEVAYATPSPSLLVLDDGLALGFRDRRRPYRRAGLYLARLSDSLEPITQPHRVGRANALGRPTLERGSEGGVYALTPHRWDKHEVLVGVHPLGRDLNRLAPEQQDYEDGARIERARGLSRDGILTLLTTERRGFGGPPARARTMTLRCQ